MSDEDLPPTHRPWGAGSDPANDASHQPPTPPPPPPPPTSQQGAPFAPPPNPYPQPGSFDQYAAPTPYGPSPYGGYPGGAGIPEHPSANTGLVLGIIGLVGVLVCGGLTLVLSPFAWVISGRALREIDASPERYSGREKASAARIMGIIGTVLLALGVIALVAILALVVAVAPTGSDNGPTPVHERVHHRGVSS